MNMFPGLVLRNVLAWHHHRPIPLIAQLPNLGLTLCIVLCILIFLFMIGSDSQQYYGLPIELRAHDAVMWESSPWLETVSVYLAAGEIYYINGKLVRTDALRRSLEQELSHRMVWTVYFEADYDAFNGDAIYAMDTI